MNTATQNQVVTDSFNRVYEQIALPVFFNRLERQYGIKAANEHEQRVLIEMAGKLYQASQQQKQAKLQSGSYLDFAAAHLDQELTEAGIGQASQPASAAQAVKQAAAAQAERPEIAEAVLTLLVNASN